MVLTTKQFYNSNNKKMCFRVNRAKALFFLIISLFLQQQAFAVEKLTLSDAIELALKNNLDIQIAKGSDEIQQNNVHIGKANFLPSVDLQSSISYQDYSSRTSTTQINSASTTTSAQIQARMTIFDGLSNINTFYKLKQTAKGSKLETRQSIENIVLEVSQRYFEVANAAEQLNISKEAVVISEERLNRAERKADFGQVSKLDVLSATVDLNSDSVSYLNAKLALNNAKRSLNVLLNREDNTEFEVHTDVDFSTKLFLDSLVQEAKEKNAAYLIQLNEIEVAESGVSIATSSFLPKLTANVGYGLNQYEEGFSPSLSDPNKGLSAGLSLSMNLFNGFQDNISRQNALISVKNQTRLKEKVWLELKQELADTYETYQNSLRIKAFEEKSLESAELNFKRTNDQFNLGQVNITTFREAQLNLIEAKSTLASARYDAKTNELKLLKLAGKLVEQN